MGYRFNRRVDSETHQKNLISKHRRAIAAMYEQPSLFDNTGMDTSRFATDIGLRLHAEKQPISLVECGLIYGTLLGDSSIGYAHNKCRFPRLYSNHGGKQQAWAEYKASRLPSLQIRTSTAANGGWGKTHIRSRSCNHSGLVPVLQTVKHGGIKIVSASWLDSISDEGMAWWYMDDGSVSFSPSGTPVIHFHTEGFSRDESALICDWLDTKYLNAHISHDGREHTFVSLDAKSSRCWLRHYKKYSIPSMDYKFREG